MSTSDPETITRVITGQQKIATVETVADLQRAAAKPKRTRGPSRKTREALEAARQAGIAEGMARDTSADRVLWVALSCLAAGAVAGALLF